MALTALWVSRVESRSREEGGWGQYLGAAYSFAVQTHIETMSHRETLTLALKDTFDFVAPSAMFRLELFIGRRRGCGSRWGPRCIGSVIPRKTTHSTPKKTIRPVDPASSQRRTPMRDLQPGLSVFPADTL